MVEVGTTFVVETVVLVVVMSVAVHAQPVVAFGSVRTPVPVLLVPTPNVKEAGTPPATTAAPVPNPDATLGAVVEGSPCHAPCVRSSMVPAPDPAGTPCVQSVQFRNDPFPAIGRVENV